MKLKICGVRSAEEAMQLVELGVDYIGLNFVPSSLRKIDLDTALEIASQIDSLKRGRTTQLVALFQDQPIDLVKHYSNEIKADFVQLHGKEGRDYASKIPQRIIKAIRAESEEAADLESYVASYPLSYLLLDRKVQGQGQIVNLKDAEVLIKNSLSHHIFLAGGLTPDNLKSVLSQVKPYGVDIASGVETDGRIDMEKVSQCLEIVRSQA